MPTLAETLESVRQKIKRIGTKPINEENTRASLIDPILRALGWDTEDLEDVQREYKVKPRDKPVDYALLSLRSVRLFIEAKALGGNLDDRRWANQIMAHSFASDPSANPWVRSSSDIGFDHTNSKSCSRVNVSC